MASTALLAACPSTSPAAPAAPAAAAALPPAWQQGRTPGQASPRLAPLPGKLTATPADEIPLASYPVYAGRNQVPRPAGQDEAYLLLSTKQFRDNPGPGRDTIMASTLRGLSEAELADLAQHPAHHRAP